MPLDTRFSCGHCDYKSKKKSNVTRHTMAVHEKRRDYKCSFCDYAASNRTNLNMHIKEVHWKIKDQECKHCDYKCTQPGDLRKHMKIVHNKIRDYECSVCGHKFGQNIDLIRHIKVHYKDKKVPENTKAQAEPGKYDCTCCDKKFNTERKLMNHGLHCKSDSFRRKIVCMKCGFKSAKVRKWARHVKEPCGPEN